MKVLLVTMYFPPAGGGGVQRPLKFATHLPAQGIETHVLAPDDPKWIHVDAELQPPTQAWVHRARYFGPRSRKLAEELHGRRGLDRFSRQARSLSRRLLVPDENVSWNLTAIPAALRIARAEGIGAASAFASRTPARSSASAIRAPSCGRWRSPSSTTRSRASSATSAAPTAIGPRTSISATGSSCIRTCRGGSRSRCSATPTRSCF